MCPVEERLDVFDTGHGHGTPLLEGFVARTLTVASPYRDRAVAVLESLGGAGPGATGHVVAGYDNCELGLCVDELVATHGIASAEGSVRAVGGAHNRGTFVYSAAHIETLQLARQRLNQDSDD